MPPGEIAKDFDAETYDLLGAHLGKHPNEPGWAGWANAHNGVAYRFRAAALADEKFTETFSFTGDRCVQEEALFSFFFNAVSCIECFLFGLHHIGALVSPRDFPIATDQDLRKVCRATVKDSFARAFPGDSVANLVIAVVADPELVKMLEYRDVLTHRGSIPRQHKVVLREPGHASIPEDVGAVFMTAAPKAAVATSTVISLEKTTTHLRRQWLAIRVRELLSETLSFCQTKLP
jgi:hypothetical protein